MAGGGIAGYFLALPAAGSVDSVPAKISYFASDADVNAGLGQLSLAGAQLILASITILETRIMQKTIAHHAHRVLVPSYF